MLNKDFREFIELLNEHNVRYLVVGGYAVAFHGYPRYTWSAAKGQAYRRFSSYNFTPPVNRDFRHAGQRTRMRGRTTIR
jgi:hypothetical protein